MIWIFVALLVGWGNAGPSLLGGTAQLPGGSVAHIVSGVTIVALSLVIARRGGLDLKAMGLRSSRWARGTAIGLISGAAIALGGLLVMQLAPLIVGGPVVYDPLRDVTEAQLLAHVLLFLPFGTVLP